MQSETWQYLNQNLQIQINKISNLFAKDLTKEEGDKEKGKITFIAKKTVDEIWGPEGKIVVSWEKTDPTQYHHGLKVKETIRMFSAIEVIAMKKETYWHLSHELTYWLGTRQQIMQKRYYPSNIIHSIMFCELTHRLFEIHCVILSNYYGKYENWLLEVIKSLQCHG
jgi:hypothetical protein